MAATKTLWFLLWEDTHTDRKVLGIYSSSEKANLALQTRVDESLASDCPWLDDGDGQWRTGDYEEVMWVAKQKDVDVDLND